ncbi:hypothetical protein GCM10010435_67500 [Winogradskya consettensis]|uniref:Integral membrane protein n=1 Tax=Winogradskya consettensis TaxID=113560 RepID=A0A919SKL0_9ACTN|nr:hypothetical protein [Actinoplanes consettensis]GIM73816.1 hypothetical protein Aco04nite_37270 [Actinoplanes consettensis]
MTAGQLPFLHAVPGIVLTLVGAYLSVAVDGRRPWAEVSGVLIGVGSSLILDEFALILHLQDVYWSPEGQLSVRLVALALSGMGLVLFGLNPLTSDDGFGAGHVAVAASALVHIAVLLVCVRKGKYSTAVLGVFLPPVAWIGAVRLARPGSSWARHRYDPDRQARAKARAAGLDARFGHWGLTIADLVAGRPSTPNPPPPAHAPAGHAPVAGLSVPQPVQEGPAVGVGPAQDDQGGAGERHADSDGGQ